jgi:hypothetical protein
VHGEDEKREATKNKETEKKKNAIGFCELRARVFFFFLYGFFFFSFLF